jgi:ABC-type polysaccharide/polyol phosphate export permease
MRAVDKSKTVPVVDTARQIAAILGLIVTMLGGCLALGYKPSWVMIFLGVAIFSYALFVPPKSYSDSENVERRRRNTPIC